MTTKPAQEPWPNAGDRACNAANKAEPLVNAFVPATPTPSQPAGAREQVMKALDWWQHSNLSIPPIAWNALCTARDALLDARQQTAAKDAEIGLCFDVIFGYVPEARDEHGKSLSLADKIEILGKQLEAAERERDSLREALADDIRADGWSVAAHNDYRLNGMRHNVLAIHKGRTLCEG